MSGRQRESHHLLHLTGASTNNSSVLFRPYGTSVRRITFTRLLLNGQTPDAPSPRGRTAHACGGFCIIQVPQNPGRGARPDLEPRRTPQTAAPPENNTRGFRPGPGIQLHPSLRNAPPSSSCVHPTYRQMYM